MRHRKKYRRLSRFGSSRNALFRNMAIALFRYERITTTLAKAKEMRGIIDKLINFGKKNDLNSRRSAFRILQDKELVKKLFNEIAPRFKDTNSGFTRIIHYKERRGDGAPLAIIELTIQKPKEKKEVKKERKEKAIKPEVKKIEEKREKPLEVSLEKEKEKEIKVVQEEKKEEIAKEEKPSLFPREEKKKSFFEGIRSLFKRKRDKEA